MGMEQQASEKLGESVSMVATVSTKGTGKRTMLTAGIGGVVGAAAAAPQVAQAGVSPAVLGHRAAALHRAGAAGGTTGLAAAAGGLVMTHRPPSTREPT